MQRRRSDPMAPVNTGRLARFDSTIFRYLPRQLSMSADRENLHAAFIHSAAILFVFASGACAILAYRVLEPFLPSILWSILAGAFLFPFKRRLTSASRSCLQQLKRDSDFLLYGLCFLLPLRAIDQTIEAIGRLFVERWKRLILILLCVPLIELLHSGLISRCLTTVAHDIYERILSTVHRFDSPWTTALVIGYLLAVIFIYDRSPLVSFVLNLLALPIWLILFMYLSQYLPAKYRLIMIGLIISLTLIGLFFDIRDYFTRKLSCFQSSYFSFSNTCQYGTFQNQKEMELVDL